MKITKLITGLLAFAILLSFAPVASAEVKLPEEIRKSAGYIDFGDLSGFSDGSESINIRLTRPLLRMIGAAIGEEDPETAQLLGKLLLVNVKVFSVDSRKEKDLISQMVKIEDQLRKNEWQDIVQVMSDGERIHVFVRLGGNDQDVFEGLAVTMLGSDEEAVFVNVVGEFTLEDIARIGQHFDIDMLEELHGAAGEASEETETY